MKNRDIITSCIPFVISALLRAFHKLSLATSMLSFVNRCTNFGHYRCASNFAAGWFESPASQDSAWRPSSYKFCFALNEFETFSLFLYGRHSPPIAHALVSISLHLQSPASFEHLKTTVQSLNREQTSPKFSSRRFLLKKNWYYIESQVRNKFQATSLILPYIWNIFHNVKSHGFLHHPVRIYSSIKIWENWEIQLSDFKNFKIPTLLNVGHKIHLGYVIQPKFVAVLR